MRIDLSGKTAIVTGSTEGIGFAIAAALAGAGAEVVVNGRGAEKVKAAAARLGDNVRGVAADLGDAEGIAKLVEAAPRADIVVNNLGIFDPADFFEADDAAWDRHWRINVMAGVGLARAYLPGMQENGWGRMIFLGSESSFNIPTEMIHYGVTKTAVVSLARGLAKRLAGTGVTVNSVLPGPTMTEGFAAMVEGRRGESDATLDELAANMVAEMRPSSIIRRPSCIDEVANMVVYVASPQASATTGAALRVDGGVIDTIM